MIPHWITFRDRRPCCIEGPDAETVRLEAATKGEVLSVERLPYPSSPNESAKPSGCPSFCWRPQTCLGKTCCPHNQSCVD